MGGVNLCNWLTITQTFVNNSHISFSDNWFSLKISDNRVPFMYSSITTKLFSEVFIISYILGIPTI